MVDLWDSLGSLDLDNMISFNLKKGIVGIALSSALGGGGAVVVDRSVVTDKEIRTSISTAITEGKVPQIDITKVSLERLSQAYFDVANEYGVDLSPTKNKTDLYEKIRDKKANNGEMLQPKTNAVLLVQ